MYENFPIKSDILFRYANKSFTKVAKHRTFIRNCQL